MKRKLEDNEKQKQKISSKVKKLSRKGRIMTCQLCKGNGHNKRFCPTLSSQQEESTSSFAVRGRGRPSTAARGSGREREKKGAGERKWKRNRLVAGKLSWNVSFHRVKLNGTMLADED
ncbi:PREDICTED: uncharacterized protein LOC109157534 [Ipomoea nil]|uniref:uncharacterized protein LOC109157534 n=1 Tax=Ipomoea nil TaxID=35883 RepID=UPI000901B384|nr:PREDICTED: uncharacterized protein LOC109157534 [Ipomoea nil]